MTFIMCRGCMLPLTLVAFGSLSFREGSGEGISGVPKCPLTPALSRWERGKQSREREY
jgi:hypothetical protein